MKTDAVDADATSGGWWWLVGRQVISS